MTSEGLSELFLKIDRMQERDLISVVELELQCGLNSRGFEKYRIALSDPKSILLVARLETDRVVGLFSATLVMDELQIDNLAVAPQWRRRNIASRLILSAFERAAKLGAVNAFLEVRAANRTAIIFYRRQGFSILGTRVAYYQNPPDDALMMACQVGWMLEESLDKKR
ncbi:MAG: GNAT family N-acetyltransferase [Acidobacteria bacterium]|nr:GNAT family N-acetyltransferase [Acidobacteriota bacterium]